MLGPGLAAVAMAGLVAVVVNALAEPPKPQWVVTFGGLEGSAVAGHNGGWGGRMPLYRPVPGVTPHGMEHSTWHTVHHTLYIAHSTWQPEHSAQKNALTIMHTKHHSAQCTLYFVSSTNKQAHPIIGCACSFVELYSIGRLYSTLHTQYVTMHTLGSDQYTLHRTVQIIKGKQIQCTQHNTYFIWQPPYSAEHATSYTLSCSKSGKFQARGANCMCAHIICCSFFSF